MSLIVSAAAFSSRYRTRFVPGIATILACASTHTSAASAASTVAG
ncbi:MAG: hypothetical protein FWJ70_05535 [Micromonosporaceae bacterium]